MALRATPLCSGAGKSSLVDVLSGRISYSGEYTINGENVTAERIREKSAYVQQEDMVSHGCVRECVRA